LNSTQPYTSQLNSSSLRKNTTLPESKENPTTSYALKNIKNKETETLSYSVITGFFLEVLEERENSP